MAQMAVVHLAHTLPVVACEWDGAPGWSASMDEGLGAPTRSRALSSQENGSAEGPAPRGNA